LFLFNYAEVAVNPPIMVPQLFGEDALIAIVVLGAFIVGLGASTFFKPKSWYIALGAGTIVTSTSLYALLKPAWGGAAFMTLAIALAAACAVTGIGLGTLKKEKKEVRDNELEKDSDQETTEAVVLGPYVDAHSDG